MNKLIDIWNRFFGSTRRVFTVLAVVGIVLAGYWMFSSAFGPELTSLTDGPLTASQLSRAADQLSQWGQTFRIRGSRILVQPQRRADLAARMHFLAESQHSQTSGLEPVSKGSSIFISESERQRRWRLSREESLASQIRNFKGLRAARVFLAGSSAQGFGRTSVEPSASVIVWTEDVQPLESQLAQAIRQTIAGTVAGLSSANVHVIDAGTGCYMPAIAQNSDGPTQAGAAGTAPADFADLCRRAQRLEDQLEQKIRDAFTYIPDLLICVTVTPEALSPDSDAPVPAVSASVNIPRSYLLALVPPGSLPSETAFEPFAAEQIDRVGHTVRAIIGRPSSLVHVDWYYDNRPAQTALLAQNDSESRALARWLQPAYVGGAIAMISLFVLLAVFVWRLIGSDNSQRSIALSRLASRQTYLEYTPDRDLPAEPLSYRGPPGVEVSAFEGLIRLDEATFRGLLSRTEPQIAALALRTSSDKLRRHILANLSAERRQAVHDHPDFAGPVRLSDIEAAQQEMVDLLQTPAEVESDELVGSAEASVT